MKVTFIARVFSRWFGRASPQADTAPQANPISEVQLQAAKEYFAAARQVVQLFDSIRSRRIAADADSIIVNFQNAELQYVWQGMRAIFPPAIRCVSSLDTEVLLAKGLLARTTHGEKIVRYAPAVKRQLLKLRTQFNPKELDSTCLNIPSVTL